MSSFKKSVMGIFDRWKASTCKASLQLAGKRCTLQRNKVIKWQRIAEREIAEMLRQGREEKARIKAEQLIANQKLESAYDILETQCELLYTRIQYIDQSKECPADLICPIATMIYAGVRLTVPEMANCVRQFELKYGRIWCQQHIDNSTQDVAPRFVGLLTITSPSESMILDTLDEIADKFGVEWKRPSTIEEKLADALTISHSSSIPASTTPPSVTQQQISPSSSEPTVLPESSSTPDKDTTGFVPNPKADELVFEDLDKEEQSISNSRPFPAGHTSASKALPAINPQGTPRRPSTLVGFGCRDKVGEGEIGDAEFDELLQRFNKLKDI
ncbi:mjk13.15 protein, putative [Perkinsus marinus ATCC 50983]|uniref:Mjk13.15 protein, putative n=1 Tax=Perkinsus marinus (strain ATCC 50983 / TXsc) TaxID=423536 RepID=C5KXH3_PERM5|nr:mjk13.15 protein, putative [Perkinsus marinus ATCC 50983]EER10697.1 mjk13.15 protein, putative [Perkinsus marinus ATCC 50983]|eukprot:XP_002778902.1 mjk13.15 protein, putative [Perkinsus marinus ATCC 50983]